MEWSELYKAWNDNILRECLWGICGSYTKGNIARQWMLYENIWVKISANRYFYDTESLMDIGHKSIDRDARRHGWVSNRAYYSWAPQYRKAKRKLRFYIKRKNEMVK